MSLLLATSFFNNIGQCPEIVKKLDKLLVIQNEKGFGIKDIQLAEHINNLIVKTGFMSIVKNYLEESIKGDQAETNFFLSNFISNTKAFLDAVAILLNYVFSLELVGGNIDFRKGMLLEQLSKTQPEITSKIKDQQKWINDVIAWRDEVIHRSCLASIIYSPPDETGKRPKDNIVRMPVKPVSIFELIQKSGLSQKMIGDQDIPTFCIEWIRQASIMFDNTLSHIEKKLREVN